MPYTFVLLVILWLTAQAQVNEYFNRSDDGILFPYGWTRTSDPALCIDLPDYLIERTYTPVPPGGNYVMSVGDRNIDAHFRLVAATFQDGSTTPSFSNLIESRDSQIRNHTLAAPPAGSDFKQIYNEQTQAIKDANIDVQSHNIARLSISSVYHFLIVNKPAPIL